MTSVVVGWLDAGDVRGEFAESVTKLAAYELAKQRLVTIMRVQSGPMLAEGRNLLVTQFLTTDAEWLLMVDSDMVFELDSVERLLEYADPVTAPVVGGLCFGVNKELGQFPTLYQRVDGLPVAQLKIPEGDVVDVDATGGAFTLTHRSVFENNERPGPHRWFHRRLVEPAGEHSGGMLSEDLSWCWWLRDNDIPIRVVLDVEVGHVKPTVVTRATYPRSKGGTQNSD